MDLPTPPLPLQMPTTLADAGELVHGFFLGCARALLRAATFRRLG